MRILLVHNYTQNRGGADEAAETDRKLLERYRHDVRFYFRHNDEIKHYSIFQKAFLFTEPTWSHKSRNDIRAILQSWKPDVLHCHSFFPLISPAVHYLAHQAGIPTVQTLHEYRLLCPDAWLLRNGERCDACVERSLFRSIFYGCYHQSRVQTASVALMLAVHRFLQTWSTQVDVFVSVSNFARQKFIEGGLPSDRCVVRPNFLVDDPGVSDRPRHYALYAGRLSSEKGIATLFDAWRELPDVPLKIVGDGPMRSWVERYIHEHRLHHVELLGFVSLSEVLAYMAQARFLLMPSIYYETFGRTIMEAYATGTPVIASRLGAMAELVQDGRTGRLFSPGDSYDLVRTVREVMGNKNLLPEWGRNARQQYENQFTAEMAYRSLLAIYQRAIGAKSGNA